MIDFDSEKCPLCGRSGRLYASAKDIEYFTTEDEYRLLICTPCDVLYVSPCMKDQLQLIYPSNYYSFSEPQKVGPVVRVKEWLDGLAFKKLLRSIEGDSIRVLDVGGGTGWLAGLVRSLDHRVTYTQVVDIDEGARHAAEKSGHEFFCGRIEDLPTDQKFDLILMLNLIEHVADPVSVLQKSKGLLSPKGRIYVKTPNFRALDATIFRNMNWGGYHCPRHFVLFSKSSFAMLAQKASLQIGSFSYTQGAPFWAISILEILRRLGIVRISQQRPSIYHPLTPLLQAAGAAFDFTRKPFMRLSQMVIVLKQ